MSEKLLVPDIGDFEEVEVIEVLAKQGDHLNINDPVITIESDKSSVEIPQTLAGKIEKVEVKVGDKVSKGDLILNIVSSAENKKENPIPKDTESIIKEAEAAMAEQKMRLKLLINLLKRKNNQQFKLQMVKIQILQKHKIGQNLCQQLFQKMEIKELTF